MNPSSDIDMYRTELDIQILSRRANGVREPAGVLIAERFRREPGLGHGHQRRLAAQVAARLDDPAGRVRPVELALALDACEGVEDPLDRGLDQALEPEVVHCSST